MSYYQPGQQDTYYDPQNNVATQDTGEELHRGIGIFAAAIGLNIAGVALQHRAISYGKGVLKSWEKSTDSVIRRGIAEKFLKTSSKIDSKVLSPIKEVLKSTSVYKAAKTRTTMLNQMREDGASGYRLKRFTSAFQNPSTFIGAATNVWRKNVLSGIGVSYAVDSLLGVTRDLGLEKKKLYDIPGQISNFAKWGTTMTMGGMVLGSASPVIGAMGSLGIKGLGKVFQGELGQSFLRHVSDKYARVQLDNRFTKYGNNYNILSNHEHKFVAEATQKKLHFGKNFLEAYRGIGQGISNAYDFIKNKYPSSTAVSRTQKAFSVLKSTLQLAKDNLSKKTGKVASSNIYHGLSTIKGVHDFAEEAAKWAEKTQTPEQIKFGNVEDLNNFFNSTFKRQAKESTLQKLFGNVLKPVRLKDVTNHAFQEDIYSKLSRKYVSDHAKILTDNLLNLNVGTNIYRNPGIKGGMVDLNFLDPVSMMRKAITPILTKSITVPLMNTKFNLADLTGTYRWISDDPDVFVTREKPNFAFVDRSKGQYSVADLTQDDNKMFVYTKGGRWAVFDNGTVKYANTNRNLGFSFKSSFDKSAELKSITLEKLKAYAATKTAAEANEITAKADHGIYPDNKYLGFLEHKGLQVPEALKKLWNFFKGASENKKGYKLEYSKFFDGRPDEAIAGAYLMQNVHEIGDQVLSRVAKDPKAMGMAAGYLRDTKLRENFLAATYDNQNLLNSILPLDAQISKNRDLVRSIESVKAYPEEAYNHSVKHPLGPFSRMTDWDNIRVGYIDNIFDNIDNLDVSKAGPHPLLNAAHNWFQKGIITSNERDALVLRAKIHSFNVDDKLFSSMGDMGKFSPVLDNVRRRSKENNWDTLNELINFTSNNKVPRPSIRREQDRILPEEINPVNHILPFSSSPNKAFSAFSEFASNTVDRVTKSIGEFTPFKKYYVGHTGIKGNIKYFGKVIGYTAMAFAGYRALDFMTATNPLLDDTMFEDGLTGAGADLAAKARLGLARVADFTGTTSAFKYLHGLAPYSETAIPGALVGGALSIMAKSNPVSTATSIIAGAFLNRMAAPYLPDMTKSHTELSEIYAGRKQVPMMKSPTWLLGGTPWEGSNVIGYSPNWYVRTKARWKETDTMYGSAFGKLIHEPLPLLGFNIGNVLDPYYMERKHYYTRPYPITGGPFDEVPVIGKVLSGTVGRIFKPPKTMHQEYLTRGMNVGGVEGDPYPFAVRPPTIMENETLMNPGPGPGQTTAGKALNYGKINLMNNKYWSESSAEDFLYDVQNFTGLKGFLAGTVTERLFNQNKVVPTLETAGRIASFSRSYTDMNLGGLGVLSEPLRRLIDKPEYRQYGLNPIPNRMPNWLPSKFLSGDPYEKLLRGELRLPGNAYLSTHSDVKRSMPARSSMLGGTTENIIQYFTGLIPPTNIEGFEIMEEGTAFHTSIQETLAAEGLLIQAEAFVQDVKNDITGHVDAIIRDGTGGGGRRVLEIKSINEKGFQKLDAPKREHLSQINFYLKNLNLNNGTMLYVNRDNPAQIKTFDIRYSKSLWFKDLAKLQHARSVSKAMMEEGIGDTLGYSYSWSDRLTILADVAPNSLEYKEAKKIVEQQIRYGSADKKDQDKYNSALKIKQSRIRSYGLYPTRFRGKVLNPESSANIQSINEDIKASSEYSLPERIVGAAWESFTNENTFLVNKFFAAKDPLEHYKMTRLYGKEYKPWDEPIRGWVDPYVRTLASKTNPLSGAETFGGLGYLFGGGAFGAVLGGTVGAAYGGLHGLYRRATDTNYIPQSVKEKREIVSYFDAAKFERNDMLASLSTGLVQQEFLKQKNATLTAFNQGGPGATVANLFRGASPFEKPYIEGWLNTRNPEEREKIISMVPEDLAQALKKQWNTNDSKDATSNYVQMSSSELTRGAPKYKFDRSIMDPRIPLEDIELKTIKQAGLDQFEFGLGWNEQTLRLQETRSSIQAANIEKFNGNPDPLGPNGSPANIRGTINNLFSKDGIKSTTQIYIDHTLENNQVDVVIRRDRSRVIINALDRREKYGL